MNQPIAYLLGRLVKSCDITIDPSELEFQLMSHPSYPSLHSITGVLNHFRINNLAVELPVDEESFSQLPNFFFTRITDEEGAHFVFVQKKENECDITFDKRKIRSLSIPDFISRWTGIVVVVEKSNLETPVEKVNAPLYTNLLFYSALLTILAIPFVISPSLMSVAYFLLCALGIVLSGMIVMQELGVKSAALDKFCGKENSSTSCDEVINSNGSKLFGIVKLSQAGLIYFSGLAICWLLFSLTGSDIKSLFWPTMMAIPVTIYSIYFQLTKVKKWCLLCLSVVLVLWVQNAIAIGWWASDEQYSFQLVEIIEIMICFLFSAVLIDVVLSGIKNTQMLKELKIEHIKFKRNYNLFGALINQSSTLSTQIDAKEIVFGLADQVAPLEIVIVTNPLCGHCKSAHELVEPLLRRFNDKIKLCIRFNVRTTHPEELSVKIARRLLEIYHTESEATALAALHDAYGEVQHQAWLDKWAEYSGDTYLEILKEESNWCEQNGINFTPEILVNGRSFPNDYERMDLLYFIEDLIEESEAQAVETAQSIDQMVSQSYS